MKATRNVLKAFLNFALDRKHKKSFQVLENWIEKSSEKYRSKQKYPQPKDKFAVKYVYSLNTNVKHWLKVLTRQFIICAEHTTDFSPISSSLGERNHHWGRKSSNKRIMLRYLYLVSVLMNSSTYLFCC